VNGNWTDERRVQEPPVAGAKSAMTASTPSKLVPDITPAYNCRMTAMRRPGYSVEAS
jgi:hypothetical protein